MRRTPNRGAFSFRRFCGAGDKSVRLLKNVRFLNKFLAWFLSHPAWAGISAICSIIFGVWAISPSNVPLPSKKDSPTQFESYSGLWKFKERSVWIKILNSGDTFQCRIPKNGEPIKSSGVISGGKIVWDRPSWGANGIDVQNDKLVLTGGGGLGDYQATIFYKTLKDISPKCDAPL